MVRINLARELPPGYTLPLSPTLLEHLERFHRACVEFGRASGFSVEEIAAAVGLVLEGIREASEDLEAT